MTTVLQLRGVTRIHGAGASQVVALRGVDLEVARGELVAIMGASGSGKSTLLNLAGGLDTATTGEVLVDGVELGGLSYDRRARRIDPRRHASLARFTRDRRAERIWGLAASCPDG